jgi:hypothetical protein
MFRPSNWSSSGDTVFTRVLNCKQKKEETDIFGIDVVIMLRPNIMS